MKTFLLVFLFSTAAGGVGAVLPPFNSAVIMPLLAAFFIFSADLLCLNISRYGYVGEKGGDRVTTFFVAGLLSCFLLLLLLRSCETKGLAFTLLHNIALLVAASSGGVLLARGLKKRTELIPVCVVAAWADICSVAMGPSGSIAREIENYYRSGQQVPAPLADFFLLKIVLPPNALALPVFGVTDWFFAAFLSAALIKLDLPLGPVLLPANQYRKAAIRLHIAPMSLFAALLVAHLCNIFVPGLLFICGGVLGWALLCDRQCFRLSRQEWVITGIFGGVITVGAGFL